jgi:hypothetical protein
MFKHHRDAVLNRVIAATTSAMKPQVGVAMGASGERMMTYRANKNLEQCLRKCRRHAMILDPFTINAAGRMVHG